MPAVLIVEDEALIAADLRYRLEDLGYRITHWVSTGEAALDAIVQDRPDVVLMDVQLAGNLDGVATALTIGERWADLPLIFLTSNSDAATFDRARVARPRAFLSKPYRDRDLVNAIALAITGAEHPSRTSAVATAAPSGPPAEDSSVQAVVLNDRLFVHLRDRLTRILLTDILWIEADGYYCKVITARQEYLITKTLKKLEALLPASPPFLRCHRSYVVNLRQLTDIGQDYVTVGERELPLSKGRRGELLARLQNL